MTVTMACDVNVLCRYLGIRPAHDTRERPSDDEARQALERLAERAYDKLHAGINAHDVTEQWRNPVAIEFDDEVACVACGCTEDNACTGGCSWVSEDPPVCSACVEGTTLADVLVRVGIAESEAHRIEGVPL